MTIARCGKRAPSWTEKQRVEYLERLDDEAKYEDQSEDDTSAYMAAAGHPCAEGYQKLFNRYERLKYAYAWRKRVVAFVDDCNHFSYQRPELQLMHHPIYDDTLAFQDFIAECVKNNWAGMKPDINYGYFEGYTTNPRVIGTLKKLKIDPHSWRRESHYWYVSFSTKSVNATLNMIFVIESMLPSGVFARRTDDEIEVDLAPLPLIYKKLEVSRIKHVTVTAHHVLIPKIPLDGTGEIMVRRATYDLIELCRKGYPWQGGVRDWVLQWYKHKKDRDHWDKCFRKQKPGIPMERIFV